MNLYNLAYCLACRTFAVGSPLSVHGADNIKKAHDLIREGYNVDEVYRSFCGYCGNYIEGKECGCGHTRRQQYYE